MSEFKPEKLFVDFKNGITETEPVIPRAYTMTHSDETGDLFLTVGGIYNWDKVTPLRDEVLAEWVNEDGKYKMKVYLHVDGEKGLKETTIRNEIFRRELPLALTAIRYGDRKFFYENNNLDNAPIIVHFNSMNEDYNKKEDWGTFKQYNMCSKEKNREENCVGKGFLELRDGFIINSEFY